MHSLINKTQRDFYFKVISMIHILHNVDRYSYGGDVK